MAMAILAIMKTVAAGRFKDLCLKMLDDVAETRTPIVITKRGRPVAKLMPVSVTQKRRSLRASVLAEEGDPFSTGETWNDGAA